MTCICTNQIADYMRKPKETYRTNQTKQTTSNVFCTSKKRKNPKSSSRKMNTKIFSNYFENYFENFYKYILVHFLFENLDFGKSTRTNSWLKFARVCEYAFEFAANQRRDFHDSMDHEPATPQLGRRESLSGAVENAKPVSPPRM